MWVGEFLFADNSCHLLAGPFRCQPSRFLLLASRCPSQPGSSTTSHETRTRVFDAQDRQSANKRRGRGTRAIRPRSTGWTWWRSRWTRRRCSRWSRGRSWWKEEQPAQELLIESAIELPINLVFVRIYSSCNQKVRERATVSICDIDVHGSPATNKLVLPFLDDMLLCSRSIPRPRSRDPS